MDHKDTILKTLSWVPLAVLAVIAFVAATTLIDSRSDVRDALAEQNRSRDRATALIALRTALLDAETGQRGYLLTGNPDYLDSFAASSARLDGVLADAFDPALQPGGAATDTEARVRGLVARKMDELDETLALHDAGQRDAALALVNTDQGKVDMDRLRAVLETSIETETAVHEASLVEVGAARSRVARAFTLLLALMGVLLVWTLANATRARRTALAERSLVLSEQARERVETLAHELDHRMKNIFAVMSGLLRQTARGKSEAVRLYAENLDGRLISMSHAYAMTRQLGEARTMTNAELVDKVVRGQILPSHSLSVDGPPLTIRERAVTPLALVLHELTTNALKYGAWRGEAVPTGVPMNDNRNTPDDSADIAPGVRVEWNFAPGQDFELTWSESATHASASSEEGYGSRLMRNCARQLGGEFQREWTPEGLRVSLRAPAESVAV